MIPLYIGPPYSNLQLITNFHVKDIIRHEGNKFGCLIKQIIAIDRCSWCKFHNPQVEMLHRKACIEFFMPKR